MMYSDLPEGEAGNGRLLETLQHLLAIQSPDLRPALDEASTLVNAALRADKVDVFLYEAERESLVAMGTSDTEVGHRQHAIGMDRQPIANDGPTVRVFQTGEPYLTGQADRDPCQLRGMVEGLGVRSAMDVPLDVGGERRGTVSVISRQRDFFSERDLTFLRAVAGWIGMVTQRSEMFEHAAVEAERRGERRSADEISRITRRERQVASLVAEGLSNAEIGERLVLVEGTVANHIAHIMRRLRHQSRTQIAVWAVERGLYRSGDEAE